MKHKTFFEQGEGFKPPFGFEGVEFGLDPPMELISFGSFPNDTLA